MAKYRLTAKHYWDDRLLDEGTVVGDDTPYPVPKEGPTMEMEGLDDAAKAEVQKVRDKVERLSAAPQLGLMYMTPENKEAMEKALSAQREAAAKSPGPEHPEPSRPTTPGAIPQKPLDKPSTPGLEKGKEK